MKALRSSVPEGYRVFEAMHDKEQFYSWFKCSDIQLDLATAVHESIHIITEERDAYPLISAKSIPRLQETSVLPPPKGVTVMVRKAFGDEDIFVQTYLAPGPTVATSSDDFTYLLDELNAFSHDLNTATKLEHTRDYQAGTQVDHRDGLAAMMAFIVAYTSYVFDTEPASWRKFQSDGVRQTLQILWKQGEDVLTASCGIPAFGSGDRNYIRYMCDTGNNAAVVQLLGRTPLCPLRCLEVHH
ncbi:hypothetical protein [Brucella anthropi]|uniref:hypothetical protein n=1 Tax=Brucella anthropi TaxID=529 RepID=UPI0011B0672E|nr:hypothetical protein [Ochrobactrum sp. MYb49]